MTYDAPPPAAPDNGLRRRNPLGLASLVAGSIPTFVSFVFQVLTPFLFSAGNGMAFFQGMSALTLVVTVLTGLAAVVLGVVGLVRPGLPRGAAAAGTALGAGALLSSAGGLLSGVVASAL